MAMRCDAMRCDAVRCDAVQDQDLPKTFNERFEWEKAYACASEKVKKGFLVGWEEGLLLCP